MSKETSNTVLGLFSGILKIALTIGGVVAGVVGLCTGQSTVVLIGVGMFLLGQVVHAIDQRAFDAQLQRWASDALAGLAPVPPRTVRMHLMRSAARTEGMRGDMKHGFQIACRVWAADKARAVRDDEFETQVTR